MINDATCVGSAAALRSRAVTVLTLPLAYGHRSLTVAIAGIVTTEVRAGSDCRLTRFCLAVMPILARVPSAPATSTMTRVPIEIRQGGPGFCPHSSHVDW